MLINERINPQKNASSYLDNFSQPSGFKHDYFYCRADVLNFSKNQPKKQIKKSRSFIGIFIFLRL